MIKITTKNENDFILKAAFEENSLDKDVVKKQNIITEFISKREAVIFLGKNESWNIEGVKKVAAIIAKANRNFQVDVSSFVSSKVKEAEFVSILTEEYILANGDVFNMKTKKKDETNEINLLEVSEEGKKVFEEASFEGEIRNWTRSFQVMPPNVLNSENYAQKLEEEFSKIDNVTVKVLNKKQIEEHKMGLLLGVNAGSNHEPRVVIVEYKGNPSSEEKTVMVGKGIMYDSGGYSLKPSRSSQGMKFDMSGTAIVAGAMRMIAKNKPNKNFSIVMPLTDNLIGSTAQTTDAVQTSMSGKTVEINNTDAEGRLILADGITYAIKELKATRIIDVATLTGAIIIALGSTYTGVWTTEEKDWKEIETAASNKNESIWRMPFHEDYAKFIRESKIADLRNTDLSGKAGSSSAAMFLKEFTDKVPFIHIDIAGTADVDGNSTAVMVKTLAELANG